MSDLIRKRIAQAADSQTAIADSITGKVQEEEQSKQRLIDNIISSQASLRKNADLLKEKAVQDVAKKQIEFEAMKEADYVPYDVAMLNKRRVFAINKLLDHQVKLMEKGGKGTTTSVKRIQQALDPASGTVTQMSKADADAISSKLGRIRELTKQRLQKAAKRNRMAEIDLALEHIGGQRPSNAGDGSGEEEAKSSDPPVTPSPLRRIMGPRRKPKPKSKKVGKLKKQGLKAAADASTPSRKKKDS